MLVLNGSGSYNGDTVVSGGTLMVLGSTGFGNTTVQNSATLAGVGTINGPLDVQNGGTVSPGTSVGGTGILTAAKNVTLESGSVFLVDINGPYVTAGSNFDQLVVNGSTNIQTGAVLQLRGAAFQTARIDVVIIQTLGTSSGQFALGVGSVDGTGEAMVNSYRALLVAENNNVILRSTTVVPTKPPLAVIPPFLAPLVVRIEPTLQASNTVFANQRIIDDRLILDGSEIRVRQIEIRIVTSVDDEGSVREETKLKLDAEWLKNLPAVLRQLPDNRYRIYLILEDGEERKALEVIVRDSIPYEADETQPDVRPSAGSAKPLPSPPNENLDETSDMRFDDARLDGVGLDALRGWRNRLSRLGRRFHRRLRAMEVVLPESIALKRGIIQVGEAHGLYEPEGLQEGEAGAWNDARSPSLAPRASVAIGAASATGVAMVAFRRSWKEAVASAVADGERRPLSKSARLWRRMRGTES